MNVGFRAAQDQGKTLSAVALICELIVNWGYQPTNVYSNVKLSIPGTHFLTNEQILELLGKTVDEELRGYIFFCDEFDRMAPSRFWNSKEQTLRTMNLWQMQKLFNWFIYTAHLGSSIDQIARDATEICVVPHFDRELDAVDWDVINALDLVLLTDGIDNASRFFPLYDRWAVAK